MRCKVCGDTLTQNDDGTMTCPVCDEPTSGEASGCAALSFPELDITDDDLDHVANLIWDTSLYG